MTTVYGAANSPGPDVFPLPCTPFERFMLLDDRPSHPMVYTVEVDLTGSIDADLLQSTLAETLSRHPLLCASLEGTALSRPRWVRASTAPRLVIGADHPPAEWHDEPIDLHSGPGIRARLATGCDPGPLTLRVHHACTDGLGLFTFVLEWLATCGRRRDRGQIPRPLPDSTTQLLRHRGRFPQSRERLSFTDRVRRIRRQLNVVSAATVPVALDDGLRNSPAAATASTGSRFYEERLSRDELALIRLCAKESGVSFNDWLLAALAQTIVRWNQERDQSSDGNRLRMTVPVDLRERDEQFTSACNRVSYKFLSRTYGGCLDWSSLLASISREMSAVREHRTVVYLKWLRRLFLIPPLARHFARPDRCMSTALLSNVGDLSAAGRLLLPVVDGRLRAGDVEILAMRAAPPRRPLTHVAIATLSYAGELSILAARDDRNLSGAAMTRFLSHFRASILSPLPS